MLCVVCLWCLLYSIYRLSSWGKLVPGPYFHKNRTSRVKKKYSTTGKRPVSTGVLQYMLYISTETEADETILYIPRLTWRMQWQYYASDVNWSLQSRCNILTIFRTNFSLKRINYHHYFVFQPHRSQTQLWWLLDVHIQTYPVKTMLYLYFSSTTAHFLTVHCSFPYLCFL